MITSLNIAHLQRESCSCKLSRPATHRSLPVHLSRVPLRRDRYPNNERIQDFFYMTRVSHTRKVVLKALQHKPRLSEGGRGKRGSARKQYPVERRGIFQVQVADADDLRCDA